jgi:pimeloyl-ACP methyl ester carboxylesterase
MSLRLRSVVSLGIALAATAISARAAAAENEVSHPGFLSRAHVLRDGAVMAYYVKVGAGPTLILIPETGGDRTQFFGQGFVDRLLPDLGVVIIESRGRGRSWPPPRVEQATMEQYADDVLEIIEMIAPNRWFVSGHSLGGMIALEIAGRQPRGLCAVITLEGWTHFTVEDDAFPPSLPQTKAWTEARQLRRERLAKSRWTPDERAAVVSIWRKWQSGPRILRETEYPVLSIWGDRNLSVLPGRDKLQLPDRPNIDVAWIHGSDHFVLQPESAAEVALKINQFISRMETK